MRYFDVVQALHQLEVRYGIDTPIELPQVILNQESRSLTNRIVALAGPWLGELGVLMIRWVPYLRHLKGRDPKLYLIASGYSNHYCLYKDFCDEYWVLPDFYQYEFLNQETSLNYGTFHEIEGNTGYRDHARRKGFRDTEQQHLKIALQFFREVKRRNISISYIIDILDNGREHLPLTASTVYDERANRIIDEATTIPNHRAIIMFLPRRRNHQDKIRNWSSDFYLQVVDVLLSELDVLVAILGSNTHEQELQKISRQDHRIINLIGEGLEQQIAFWSRASVGMGPPSGGLVPGYLTRTPLLHWYKTDNFPTRHGLKWNEVAESDYTVFGIKSEWIEINEDDSSIKSLLSALMQILYRDNPSNSNGSLYQ